MKSGLGWQRCSTKKKKLPLLPAAAAAKLGQTINLEQILYFSFEEKNCQNLSKF